MQALLDQLNSAILGKPDQIQNAVIGLLAGGHLLIEDLPGVGKTTLAHALARSLGLAFARVQFTADLMPSDLLGVSVWSPQTQRFDFHPGPLFTQVLLADEINRASPRTQSALLEAMQEQQVSVEGATRALPQPFFVIATQNPTEQHGTFPLPESQLDRFAMRLSLGYPSAADERALLTQGDARLRVQALPAVLDANTWRQQQVLAAQVFASPALLDQLQTLVAATRQGLWFAQGLSPRAALGILGLARARAHLLGRDYVAPDDLRDVWALGGAHRVLARPDSSQPNALQLMALYEQTLVL